MKKGTFIAKQRTFFFIFPHFGISPTNLPQMNAKNSKVSFGCARDGLHTLSINSFFHGKSFFCFCCRDDPLSLDFVGSSVVYSFIRPKTFVDDFNFLTRFDALKRLTTQTNKPSIQTSKCMMGKEDMQ